MSDEKVINLHKGAGAHEPPEGWTVRGPFGFMEFDSGAADGRLARLGDVLRWLEEVRELPRSRALDVLISGLPEGAMACMYGLKSGAYAQPLPVDYMFGFHTPPQHEEAKRVHSNNAWSGLGSTEWRSEFPRRIEPYQGPPVSEPGLPVLRLLLSCWKEEKRWVPAEREWVNTTDLKRGNWQANYLAVPLSKASEWWGYGRVVAEQDGLNQSPAGAPEPEPDGCTGWGDTAIRRRAVKGLKGNAARWTDPQCLALHDELTRLECLRDAGKGGSLTPLKQAAKDLAMRGYQSLDAPRKRGKELAAKRQAEAAQGDAQKIRKMRSVFGS